MKICLLNTRFQLYDVGREEIYVKRLYDSLSKKHTVYNVNNTLNKKLNIEYVALSTSIEDFIIPNINSQIITDIIIYRINRMAFF